MSQAKAQLCDAYKTIGPLSFLGLSLLLTACSTAVPRGPFSVETAFSGPRSISLERQQAQRRLNHWRTQAQLAPLQSEPHLTQAAQQHAAYLQVRPSSHFQQSGDPLFRGATPADRAVAAGYPGRNVAENFTQGTSGAKESVDQLMSAIYHRFAFLNPAWDQVGIGYHQSNGQDAIHTYLLGSMAAAQLCQSKTPSNRDQVYANACADASALVSAKALDALKNRGPKVILWPPANSVDQLPAFFEESPDPLPDRSVSGLPLSAQFSAQYFDLDTLQIDRWQLFTQDRQEIRDTRLLNRHNDPNQLMQPGEYALFPLQPLDWNQRYISEIAFHDKRQTGRHRWQFQTANPGAPVTNIHDGMRLRVRSGQTIVLRKQHDPSGPATALSQLLRRNSQNTCSALDPDTWRCQPTGPDDSRIDLSLNGAKITLSITNPQTQ